MPVPSELQPFWSAERFRVVYQPDGPGVLNSGRGQA